MGKTKKCGFIRNTVLEIAKNTKQAAAICVGKESECLKSRQKCKEVNQTCWKVKNE